jgi:predicted transglutaminase-like cysteine proteinase
LLWAGVTLPLASHAFPADLFGYRQLPPEPGIQSFPQWVSALERQFADKLADGDCGAKRLNRCHMAEWRRFVESLRPLSVRDQLEAVNRYANSRDYVLDLANYALEDYWAIPREFLPAGGDCEDYAITKFFSLRWLGFRNDELRLVVVQDTNLRIPHAVLAVSRGSDVAILDNQSPRVVSHREIVHYVPVYSINDRSWWMHLPPAK